MPLLPGTLLICAARVGGRPQGPVPLCPSSGRRAVTSERRPPTILRVDLWVSLQELVELSVGIRPRQFGTGCSKGYDIVVEIGAGLAAYCHRRGRWHVGANISQGDAEDLCPAWGCAPGGYRCLREGDSSRGP